MASTPARRTAGCEGRPATGRVFAALAAIVTVMVVGIVTLLAVPASVSTLAGAGNGVGVIAHSAGQRVGPHDGIRPGEGRARAPNYDRIVSASCVGAEAAPTIVNLGGEGEVAGAVTFSRQGSGEASILHSRTAQRVAVESQQPVVMAEGNNLPFRTGSVDQVWTNNVPVGKGSGYFGPNFDPAEIFRILREGGSWLGNSAP